MSEFHFCMISAYWRQISALFLKVMSSSARMGCILWSIGLDFDLYTTSKRLTHEVTGELPDEFNF